MAAPASTHARASVAHSSGAYATEGARARDAASFRPTSMMTASRSLLRAVVPGVGEPAADVLAERRLPGVVVEPGVEAVLALAVGDRAGDGGDLVVGDGERGMVAGGLAGQRPLDRRRESLRLAGHVRRVALEELGQHLSSEQLEALHHVLVTVAARLAG